MSIFGKKKEKNEIVIVAHNASFHPDDVFAVATIVLALEMRQTTKPIRIIRSRNPEDWAVGDYVVDVGGEYDASRNRFDHHQKGGAGKRDNGVPYAAFGLVWKHVGPDVCVDVNGNADPELWQNIDNAFVAAIDANDNGFDLIKNLIPEIFTPTLSLMLMIEKPTWEERNNEEQMYERFMIAVEKAKSFLKRYIEVQRASVKAQREIREAYESAPHKAIVIFPHDYERINFIYTLAPLPDILFFVYPNHSGTWTAETVPVSVNSFEKRKAFPAAWAGLSGADFAKVSGVDDAYFCHNGLFVAYATSKEGAYKLAKLALEL